MRATFYRNLIRAGSAAALVVVFSCDKKISIVKINDGLSAEEHVKLGMIYFSNGEFKQAKQQFRRATVEDRQNPFGWFGLGLCEHRDGHFTSAARDFRTAAHLKPDYAEARNNLADALLQLGRLTDAAKEAEQAVRLGGDEAAVYHLTYAQVLWARRENAKACAEAAAAERMSGGEPAILAELKPLQEHCRGR